MQIIDFKDLNTIGEQLIVNYQSFEITNCDCRDAAIRNLQYYIKNQNLSLLIKTYEYKHIKYVGASLSYIIPKQYRIVVTISVMVGDYIYNKFCKKTTGYTIIKYLCNPYKLTVQINEESEIIKSKIYERSREVDNFFRAEGNQ